ncbi:glutathione S-transferase [Planktotalea sp.]|uniref:glutathione S-transferase n=1 Tax=Planktotalea sp. TaxID=2029877 RepID=UPI003F6C2BB8
MSVPVLYSFRRCPYAMRARLAIASAGLRPEHREIVLRDKAPEFLAASPKGTVPVLVVGDLVIEESLDVMRWALAQNDPENLLKCPAYGLALIEHCDGPFKTALDRTKYVSRYGTDPEAERARAQPFLDLLGARLDEGPYLCGSDITLADLAIFPFIRQFAHIDRARFDMDAFKSLRKWLDQFLASERFASIMYKYRMWHAGDPLLWFGDVQA